jgi:peptide/nickel transport system substrate-binding protein
MKNKGLFFLLVSAMLWLAGCGGQTGNGNSAQPATGSGSANGTFDPALATGASTKAAISHVYEGLAGLVNNQPTLLLAVDMTASEDKLDYVVTLRPGVTFHDGTPLNADAVVLNFNRWFDPKDPLHGSGSYTGWSIPFGGFKGETTSTGNPKSEFDGIEKQNELSVILHLNTPDPNLLSKLSDSALSIVSPAALKAPGFGTSSGTDGGTGPYKIGKWNGSSLTLDPNSSYWKSAAIPTASMDVTLAP